MAWWSKGSLSHFSKKLSFWEKMDSVWPKIIKSYITLTALEIFHFFLSECGVIVRDISHISQFSPKITFFDWLQFEQKLCNLILMIYCAAIFLKWHSMVECNTWTKAILVSFSKKFPFGEVTHTQFGPKLCNLLPFDLLFEGFYETF